MKYFRQHLPHNSWTNAFTLIELAITIALIVMILTIGLPVMLNMSALFVRNQATMLQTTCWALQQQAIAQNKQLSLIFNEAANSWSIGNETTKLAPGVKFGIMPHVFGPPANPINTLTRAITFANATITAHPSGRISPGSVYLIDEHAQTLYAVTAPVSRISYMRVYRYNHPHWQLCT
jgi:type II secretory pathway pseudopilin PulG